MAGAEQPASPEPSQILQQAMTGYVVPQALYVATALGIADQLESGPLGADELARRTGAEPDALKRLLRVLCGVGVFAEFEDGYAPTALGAYLVAGTPDSVRSAVLIAGREQYRAWGELLHSVRTGEAAFPHVSGVGWYDYMAQHPEAGRAFDLSMRETGASLWPQVVRAYDFSAVHSVVDVGGGHGALLAAVLRAHPALRGVLYDLPHVVADAGAFLQAAGVLDRCEVAGGSFFDSVPEGGDLYLLARTLLNWDRPHVLTVLRNCRRVLAPHARLLLLEPVLPERQVTLADALNDLNLLVLGGGRMCTAAELGALLEEGGFSLLRILTTPTRLSIVEGAPAVK
jgi:SAM-dependent methyltransferase